MLTEKCRNSCASLRVISGLWRLHRAGSQTTSAVRRESCRWLGGSISSGSSPVKMFSIGTVCMYESQCPGSVAVTVSLFFRVGTEWDAFSEWCFCCDLCQTGETRRRHHLYQSRSNHPGLRGFSGEKGVRHNAARQPDAPQQPAEPRGHHPQIPGPPVQHTRKFTHRGPSL